MIIDRRMTKANNCKASEFRVHVCLQAFTSTENTNGWFRHRKRFWIELIVDIIRCCGLVRPVADWELVLDQGYIHILPVIEHVCCLGYMWEISLCRHMLRYYNSPSNTTNLICRSYRLITAD